MRHPRLLLLLGAVFVGSLFARETQPLPPGVPADLAREAAWLALELIEST